MEIEDMLVIIFCIVIGLFFIFLIVFMFGVIYFNEIGASQGKHTGYVTAVEFNDNILWDANLVYFKTDTESTQEDVYCVNDKSLKIKLEEFTKSKTKITIIYNHPFWFWRSLCNGGESIIVGYET